LLERFAGVVAVDKDPVKQRLLQANAGVYGYGVGLGLHPYCGDFFDATALLAAASAASAAASAAASVVVGTGDNGDGDIGGGGGDGGGDGDSVAQLCPGAARLAHSVRAVLVSPPWGGVEYSEKQAFDVQGDLAAAGVRGLLELITAAAAVCPNVLLLLPRNTLTGDVHAVATKVGGHRPRAFT
jgi:hypothetical protein